MTFVSMFLRVAAAHEAAVALEGDGQRLTYGALRERVGRFAAVLHTAGVRRGDRVALSLPRSPDFVVAMLACWWLGAAWVPLERSWPSARRELVLRETSARIVVTEVLCDLAPHPHAVVPSDAELAYVLYTSGSTGAPKGVRVTHAGLVPVLQAQIEAFGLGPGKRVLQVLAHVFDASISDIGTALLSGATLIVDPGPLEPSRVHAALASSAATHVDLPPAVLRRMVPGQLPSTLETVVVGGEPTPAEVLTAWARHVRVVVAYGPTEATICTSLCEVDADRWQVAEIGRPIAGAEYRVEDGELWIASPGLALGYVDRPQLEAQRFVVRDGTRWYRSGDRVRGLGAERWEFVGRIDRQLKVRGVLIAPEEIEAVLRAHPSVLEAAVLLRDQRLVAFVSGSASSSALLRSHFRERLPRALWPQQIEWIPALPRTASGKIDHDALGQQPFVERETTLRAPRSWNENELVLAQLWRAALGPDVEIERTSDFVSLGGDSLAALEIVASAEARGLAITSEALYRGASVAELAAGAAAAPCAAASLRADVERELAELGAVAAMASRPGRVLLTGATGFFGAWVLSELLAAGADVVCVVRANDEVQARARVLAALHEQELHAARAFAVVVGDLTLPRFGLDARSWRDLAEQVTEIHHLAAAVNLVLPYSRLYGPNVLATKHVLQLATSGVGKKVHYASTLSVGACATPVLPVLFEDAELSAEWVFGGYAASKWAAELLVQRAQEVARVDIRSVRLGLLTAAPSARQPRPSCQLESFVRGLVALRGLPVGVDTSLAFDVTPVDHAARAFVALAAAPAGTWHLANPQPATLGQLTQAIAACGVRLESVAAEAFVARIAAPTMDRTLATTVLSACRRMLSADFAQSSRHLMSDLFLATDQRFDLRRSQLFLAAQGLSCPRADAALLQRYVQNALLTEPV